jgi:hypothetical protein
MASRGEIVDAAVVNAFLADYRGDPSASRHPVPLQCQSLSASGEQAAHRLAALSEAASHCLSSEIKCHARWSFACEYKRPSPVCDHHSEDRSGLVEVSSKPSRPYK